jgi:hypothetical protein
VKNWRNFLVLNVGLLLVLSSFIVYGARVAQTSIPAGSTPQQIEQLTQQYGLDRPFIEQYDVFLLMFLPGFILLWIYGTIGISRPDNPIWILPKIILVLILFTNVITALNSLAIASKAEALSPPAFWLFLAVAALGLANFVFCLVVWNGYRWGMWCLGISTFLMFILKFSGSVPIVPSLFELSAVVVLYFLIRPVWSDMD